MTADERRLLELLAESDDGCTDALLRAHAPVPMGEGSWRYVRRLPSMPLIASAARSP
jgi:hypothetical protein